MSDKIIRVASEKSVEAALDDLQHVLKEKGAVIFARVPHAKGGRAAGFDLDDSELLIFGNPKIGSPAIVANPLSALYLPLKILGYMEDGQTYLAYEDPKHTFGGLVGEDTEYLAVMEKVLSGVVQAVV